MSLIGSMSSTSSIQLPKNKSEPSRMSEMGYGSRGGDPNRPRSRSRNGGGALSSFRFQSPQPRIAEYLQSTAQYSGDEMIEEMEMSNAGADEPT